jgi:hypothetical protein
MSCGDQVWVFAQTVMPDSTLCAHPWLAELGDSALGETLSDCRASSAVPTNTRGCRRTDAVTGAGAARRRGQARRPVGAALAGVCCAAPLLIQELFLPAWAAHRLTGVPLPRSGDRVGERIAERWRWFVYRVRFHPWTTTSCRESSAAFGTTRASCASTGPSASGCCSGRPVGAVDRGRGKPDPRIFHHLRAGRRADALGRLRHQRLCRPQLRSARGAHQGPAARGGPHLALEALVLFAVLSLTALMLALQLNKLDAAVCRGGRRGFLAVTYPFIKRFLSVPQLYLGVTFGWGIPMAFAAQLEQVPRVAWLLLLANMLWVTVYDTIYAMVDRDDDVKIGVRSTAILFGDSDRHIIACCRA